MNRRVLVYGICVIIGIFFISGCETAPKKLKEEVSGIKTRVDTLESRVEGVESKQAEVERATGEQAQTLEELKAASQSAVKTNVNVKTRPGKSTERTKDIQLCLKNAGFYNGKIDGIKGKATKKAVKEFQKANGLKADGVVGPKTWELLSKYGEGAAQGADQGAAAAQSAASGAEEGAAGTK